MHKFVIYVTCPLLTVLLVASLEAQLIGRKVGPDYMVPAAETAGNWIDFNNPNVISDAHLVDDAQWWRVFGDPEIEKIVGLANSQNLPLQAALIRIRQRHYEQSVAVGNLFPQGQNLTADYQRQQFSENGTPFGLAGLGERSFDLFQFGFNASWEVDLWGRIRRSIEATDAKVGISVEDERDLRLSITAAVIAAYTEIRVYEQRITNAYQQVESQKKTQQIANAKYNNGSTSILDVTQSNAVLEITGSKIPELEMGLREANNRLCLLLGIPPKNLVPIIGLKPIPMTPETILVGVPCDLIRRRPDVRRAEREVAAQSALIGVATADLYPAFSLKGTINWQSFAFSDLFQSSSQAGTLVPGVRWDVLNYGRIRNRIRAQEAQFEEAVVNYQQTVLKANTEAENALNGFLKKKEQVGYLERAVAATRQSVETSRKQYEAGAIEFNRLNDLQKELVKQLDSLSFEQGQAALALIQVYKAMGGGWAFNSSATTLANSESTRPQSIAPVSSNQSVRQTASMDGSQPTFPSAPTNARQPNASKPNAGKPNVSTLSNMSSHSRFTPVSVSRESVPESRPRQIAASPYELWKSNADQPPAEVEQATFINHASQQSLWSGTPSNAMQEAKQPHPFSHYNRTHQTEPSSAQKLWR